MNATQTPTVAATILAQLGGSNRLFAMVGANNFVDGGNYLSFRLGMKGTDGINAVRVTLTPADEYRVEFFAIRGTKFRTVATVDGVPNTNLRECIENATGLRLSL